MPPAPRVRQARRQYPGGADRRVRACDRLTRGLAAGCREFVRDHVCQRAGPWGVDLEAEARRPVQRPRPQARAERRAQMDTVTSADGTVIAFDRYGDGPPDAAAAALPQGRLAVLPGQSHDLNADATAPVMAEFLAS